MGRGWQLYRVAPASPNHLSSSASDPRQTVVGQFVHALACLQLAASGRIEPSPLSSIWRGDRCYPLRPARDNDKHQAARGPSNGLDPDSVPGPLKEEEIKSSLPL
jgi:hypothetical protein